MIYAIVGPTGVGKTKLSIELAKKLNAEVINCDCMQIYKELNIGTAKITKKEMENIKHHMLSIKSITEEYNVFNYQNDARNILNSLLNQNKNVVIVGGTGLYLKALLYDYNFNDDNKKNEKIYNFKLIGLTKERENLYEAINNRVNIMINNGLIEEAKYLYDKYKTSRVLNAAIGYKEFFPYFEDKIKLEEAIENIKKSSRHYAKRQFTFFNNQFLDIEWFDVSKAKIDDIVKKITEE